MQPLFLELTSRRSSTYPRIWMLIFSLCRFLKKINQSVQLVKLGSKQFINLTLHLVF